VSSISISKSSIAAFGCILRDCGIAGCTKSTRGPSTISGTGTASASTTPIASGASPPTSAGQPGELQRHFARSAAPGKPLHACQTSAPSPPSAASAKLNPPVPHTRALPLIHPASCRCVPKRIHGNPNGGANCERIVSSNSHASGAPIASGNRRAKRRSAAPWIAV